MQNARSAPHQKHNCVFFSNILWRAKLIPAEKNICFINLLNPKMSKQKCDKYNITVFRSIKDCSAVRTAKLDACTSCFYYCMTTDKNSFGQLFIITITNKTNISLLWRWMDQRRKTGLEFDMLKAMMHSKEW